MEPVSFIVGALAAGAATGLTDTTSQFIKDSYAALKALILRKHPDAPADMVEKKPESEGRRDGLIAVLREEGAASDEELVAAARELMKAVEDNEPKAAATVGVDLKRVWADTIEAEGVKASGGSTAVRAEDVTARSMKFKDIETQGQDSDHP